MSKINPYDAYNPYTSILVDERWSVKDYTWDDILKSTLPEKAKELEPIKPEPVKKLEKYDMAPLGYEIIPFTESFVLLEGQKVYLNSHGWIDAGGWEGVTVRRVRVNIGYTILGVCQPGQRFKTDKPYPFGY